MKKSYVLLIAFCGLIGLLLAPGIAAADGPVSPVGFVPRADNTYYLPNTGGGAGPEWGPYVGVDSHGDASPYMRDPNGWTPGPLYSGMVLTWLGDSSTLPTGISFNTPFDFRTGDPGNPPSGAPSSLDALLSGPFGSRVNDLVVYMGGISSAWVISEPVRSLLPFETGTSPYPSPPYIEPWLQEALWNGLSSMYQQTQLVVIPADTGQVYTKYVAQNLYWPMWDPTVPDAAYYAGSEVYCNRSNVCTSEPRWNSDYPAPSTWTQYNFYIQNDTVGIPVPEPGASLLLGFGLIALAGMRRVVKAKA